VDIDEVECPYELVRKRLRDILLKKCDLPDFGLVFSRELGGGDVAGENLNIIAIADARQGHIVKRRRACPSTDVYDPRYMRNVDSGRDKLRIVE
jgi:hypothetical protein